MTRMMAVAVFLCWSLCACDFDTERQLSLELPVSIIANNSSQAHLDVLAIYSNPQTGTVFSLKGNSLSPGDKISVKAPESALEAMRNKSFYVDFKCPSKGVISVEGKDIKMTENDDHTIELWLINPCK